MDKYDDNLLKQTLRQGAFKADKNPWFTKKVINRLPEKQRKSAGWILYAVCFSAIAAYAFLWPATLSDTTPVTLLDGLTLPRNVISGIVTTAVSMLALQQIIGAALSRQD